MIIKLFLNVVLTSKYLLDYQEFLRWLDSFHCVWFCTNFRRRIYVFVSRKVWESSVDRSSPKKLEKFLRYCDSRKKDSARSQWKLVKRSWNNFKLVKTTQHQNFNKSDISKFCQWKNRQNKELSTSIVRLHIRCGIVSCTCTDKQAKTQLHFSWTWKVDLRQYEKTEANII